METLNINFILFSTERTGGTRTILNYANELNHLGHEITLTTLYHDPWFKLNEGILVYSKRTKMTLYHFYGSMLINKKLKKTSLFNELPLLRKLTYMAPKADINVATYPPTAYVASWLKNKSVPFYFMMHDPEIFAVDPIQQRFYGDTLFLPINKIVNSSWLRDRVYAKTGIEYPMVNMGAIDLELFKPPSVESKNDKSGEIHIVALGKGGFKNPKFLMDAIKTVRIRNPSTKIVLHFFGHRLPDNIDLDANTIFHKDITDKELAQLYSNCDIQVTTSTAESFPLPPLEAMASGCAVITTPFGTEDYAINGLNCLTVHPNDTAELVEKLEQLIHDPFLRKKLIEEGLKTVKRFNYSDQAKTLVELFKSAKL